LAQQGINNVRIYCHDAIEIMENKIADHSLAGVHLFFPDPWPKKKHHKRRIVRSSVVNLLVKKLKSGGYFHAATDWQNYAEHLPEVSRAEGRLITAGDGAEYCERPDYRPLTKAERRGLRLGHGVWDRILRRV